MLINEQFIHHGNYKEVLGNWYTWLKNHIDSNGPSTKQGGHIRQFNVNLLYGHNKDNFSYWFLIDIEELSNDTLSDVCSHINEMADRIFIDALTDINTNVRRKRLEIQPSDRYQEHLKALDEENKVKAKEKQDNIKRMGDELPDVIVGIIKDICVTDQAKKVVDEHDKKLNSLVGMAIKASGGIYDAAAIKSRIITELFNK